VHVREGQSGACSPRFAAGLHVFGSASATASLATAALATAALECAAPARRNAPATSAWSGPLGGVAVPGKG
jgi:hypothetical protein